MKLCSATFQIGYLALLIAYDWNFSKQLFDQMPPLKEHGNRKDDIIANGIGKKWQNFHLIVF